jgi:hypothetical protein
LRLDQTRHELACANCGAPLRDFKRLPVAQPAAAPAVSHQTPVRFAAPVAKRRPKKRKPARRRKSWFAAQFKDMVEEVFDAVEDIFD